MSINILGCITLIKNLALVTALTVATSVSLSFDVLAKAQVNPHPTIFKEYPYSRAPGRKVKRSSNHRSKAKPNTIKKQGAALNNRKKPFTRVQKTSPNEPFTVEFHAPGYPKR